MTNGSHGKKQQESTSSGGGACGSPSTIDLMCWTTNTNGLKPTLCTLTVDQVRICRINCQSKCISRVMLRSGTRQLSYGIERIIVTPRMFSKSVPNQRPTAGLNLITGTTSMPSNLKESPSRVPKTDNSDKDWSTWRSKVPQMKTNRNNSRLKSK